jgi:starch phosphorylase
VADGFDRFNPQLIEHYLGDYAQNSLGIPPRDLLALGRLNPDAPTEDFSMAYLAVRGSGAINGVSRLHGKVSRGIFQSLFPGWPEIEVPVGHVTNGVHMPSWDSAEADVLWTEYCGKERWLGITEILEEKIRCAPNDKLWQLRADARKSLVGYVRERLSKQLAASGETPEKIKNAQHIFDATH